MSEIIWLMRMQRVLLDCGGDPERDCHAIQMREEYKQARKIFEDKDDEKEVRRLLIKAIHAAGIGNNGMKRGGLTR